MPAPGRIAGDADRGLQRWPRRHRQGRAVRLTRTVTLRTARALHHPTPRGELPVRYRWSGPVGTIARQMGALCDAYVGDRPGPRRAPCETTTPACARPSPSSARSTRSVIRAAVPPRSRSPSRSRTAGGLFVAPVAHGWDEDAFSSGSESQLVSLQNQARASAGLRTLKQDTALRTVARWRSRDMARRLPHDPGSRQGSRRVLVPAVRVQLVLSSRSRARTSGRRRGPAPQRRT